MSGLEVLGVAASIIQVADAGIRLAENLYAYVDSVHSADQKLGKVAADVRLTANLVSHVGSLFKEDGLAVGAGEKELRTATDCVKRCELAYGEVEVYMRKAKKSKWMFPLREKRLDVLNARLDQLKNDLHLMLSVIKNRNDLKAAVERKGQLEQRDVYFLKEIEVLRRAQQNSESRYLSLRAEYKKVAQESANEGDTSGTDVDQTDEEEDADDAATIIASPIESAPISTVTTATTGVHNSPSERSLPNIDVRGDKSTAAASRSIQGSPRDLQTPSRDTQTSSRDLNTASTQRSQPVLEEPPDDYVQTSRSLLSAQPDDPTRFTSKDLEHLKSHIYQLNDRIDSLRWRLQQPDAPALTVSDTHHILTTYGKMHECVRRAQDGFRTSLTTLPSARGPPCEHAYYDPPAVSPMELIKRIHERGSRLDALTNKTDNLAVSAQGFRRGANRVRSGRPTIRIGPVQSLGSGASSVVGTLQKGFSWLAGTTSITSPASPESWRVSEGWTENATVAGERRKEEAQRRREADVDFEGVEKLLRAYTAVFDME